MMKDIIIHIIYNLFLISITFDYNALILMYKLVLITNNNNSFNKS